MKSRRRDVPWETPHCRVFGGAFCVVSVSTLNFIFSIERQKVSVRFSFSASVPKFGVMKPLMVTADGSVPRPAIDS